ncbi:MAG: hypothetical protein GY859_32330 [Desulfobacterales bacterium]|nr:hypothetical protein [Desulfobacterales bacterium]
MTRDSRFELHYFPNISAGAPPEKPEKPKKDQTFEPTDFTRQSGAENQADFLPGARFAGQSNPPPPERPGLAPETPPRQAAPPASKWTDEKVLTLEKEAYDKGFNEGMTSGLASGKKEIEPALNSCTIALSDLERIKEELRLHAERAAVELAMGIARKIIQKELAADAGIVISVIREALTKIVDHENIKIKIRSEDLRHVQASGHQFTDLVGSMESITIEEDDSIGIGGCQIETNFGDIDATIKTQLEVLEGALRAELQNAMKSP